MPKTDGLCMPSPHESAEFELFNEKVNFGRILVSLNSIHVQIMQDKNIYQLAFLF